MLFSPDISEKRVRVGINLAGLRSSPCDGKTCKVYKNEYLFLINFFQAFETPFPLNPVRRRGREGFAGHSKPDTTLKCLQKRLEEVMNLIGKLYPLE